MKFRQQYARNVEDGESISRNLSRSGLAGLAVSLYCNFAPMHGTLLKIEAAAVLGASFLLVYAWRRNGAALVMAGFIAYFNYSVLVAEYLLPDLRLGASIRGAVTLETLSIALRCMAIFLGMLLPLRVGVFTWRAPRIRGDFFAWVTGCAYLGFALLFGVDRSGSSIYAVRISPLYEYSFIVVAIALVASGKSRGKKSCVVSLSALLVLQDAFLGGRVTSLQILTVLGILLFTRWIKIHWMAIAATAGVILGTAVGIARSTGDRGFSVAAAIDGLQHGLFVSSTATHSFYTSLTHVAAADMLSTDERASLLAAMFRQVVVGGEGEMLVTRYISDNYFANVGGGLFYSHFYAIGGYAGVAIASGLLCLLLAWLVQGGGTRPIRPFLLVIVVASCARWYAYTPTALFRCLVLASIVYAGYILWLRLLRVDGASGIPKPAIPGAANLPV